MSVLRPAQPHGIHLSCSSPQWAPLVCTHLERWRHILPWLLNQNLPRKGQNKTSVFLLSWRVGKKRKTHTLYRWIWLVCVLLLWTEIKIKFRLSSYRKKQSMKDNPWNTLSVVSSFNYQLSDRAHTKGISDFSPILSSAETIWKNDLKNLFPPVITFSMMETSIFWMRKLFIRRKEVQNAYWLPNMSISNNAPCDG